METGLTLKYILCSDNHSYVHSYATQQWQKQNSNKIYLSKKIKKVCITMPSITLYNNTKYYTVIKTIMKNHEIQFLTVEILQF